MTRPVAPHETSAAEITPGTFTVGADGAASYRLAVRVPPGIEGTQPDIALAYNHNHGNGDLGVGWRLDGLSAVTRVKATYAVDGFNGGVSYGPNDRFAIDGQRLVNVQGAYGAGGTIYNTEIQTYQRVQAGATDLDGFTVTAKAGTKAEYGTTPDSRVLAGEHVRVWALSANQDLNGNRVEYEYTTTPTGSSADTGDGASYLKRVTYTANPARNVAANRFVEFDYEARPDEIVTAFGGYLIRTKFRLAHITVRVGELVVRKYTITYDTSEATQRSVITSITESGAASDGSPTLPPTLFTWQDAGTPSFEIGTTCELRHVSADPIDVRTMDVTGRGRTDLVQLWVDRSDNTLRATTYLAKGDGTGATFECAGTSVLGTFPAKREILPVDIDGDGRTDLVVAYASGLEKTLKLAVFRSTGTGFVAHGEPFDTGDTWDIKHLRFFAMDVNGDGRTDIVQAFSSYDPDEGELLGLRTYLSEYTGAGGTFGTAITFRTDDPANPKGLLGFWPVDVTGDGMMDLVRAWRTEDGHVTVATYHATSVALDQVSFETLHSDLGTFAITNQIALLPVDVNGDGIQDLVQIWQEAGPGTTTLHLCTFRATGTGVFVKGEDSAFTDERLTAGNVFALDIDGAGATAIVGRWNTQDRIMFTAFRASPSGRFRKLPPFAGQQAGQDARWSWFLPGDVDANGRADLIRLVTTGDNQTWATPYVSAGPHLDVLKTITSPLGAHLTIDYAPLSDSAVYSSHGAPAFPTVDALRYAASATPTVQPARSVLGSAIHVVPKWTETAAASRNRFAYEVTRSMTYYDAKADLSGRGWLGFAAVTVLEPHAGRRTTTEHRQDFPYVGVPSEVVVEAVPGTDPRVPVGSLPLLVSTTTNTYSKLTTGSGASTVNAIRLTETRESRFDYGVNRFDYALGHRFEYDDYGNPILTTNLGYVDPDNGQPLNPDKVVHRHRLFRNDVTADTWALGHLLYEKVTRNAQDPDITKFQAGDFSLRAHVLAEQTYAVVAASEWDDTASTFHTTAYEYDAFGHVIAETPPGGAATRHEYDPDYHTFRMKTTTPPCPETPLVEYFGYDPRFGTRTAHLDVDGRIWVEGHDAFGRQSAMQAPARGTTTDLNAVPECVTGTMELRARFREAAMLTVVKVDRTVDTAGNQVVSTAALQDLPTGNARCVLVTKTYVDGRGRVRETVRESGRVPAYVVELTNYDSEDHVVCRSLPFLAGTPVVQEPETVVRTAYDVLGRLISRTTPTGKDGTSTTHTTWYHGQHGVVTEVRAAGTEVKAVRRLSHHRYDGEDRVTTVVVEPDGIAATTTFEFDALGRLLRSTDPATASNPNGVSTTITYDSLSRRTTLDCPDLNPHGAVGTVAVRYHYDSVTGLPSRETDAAGLNTDYTYDQLRRLATKHLSDGRVVTYTYDALGGNPGSIGRITVTEAQGTEQSKYEYGYDEWGEITRTTLTVKGAPASFVTSAVRDAQRRVVSRTLPDGMVETLRYSFGRLVHRALGTAQIDLPLDQYDARGQATKRVYGSGVRQLVITDTFAPTGQRYRQQATGPDGTVLDLSYEYDQLDRLIVIGDACNPTESWRFGYRDQRLAHARRGTTTAGLYEYDASGNLRGRDGYSYDYQAHFARIGSADGELRFQATQDACGRTLTRTTAGVTLTFDYDGFGALRNVRGADNAVIVGMVTNHEGQVLCRKARDGTVTVHVDSGYRVTRTPSGQETVDRYLSDGTATAARICGGPGSQPEVTYFRRDTKGSVTHVFDAAATLVGQTSYDPFGCQRQVLGSTDPHHLYENRAWLGDVGLYDFGGRYYDPVRGRFLTPDPGLGASDPYRLDVRNRFAFELNDPVNLIDPTGYDVANAVIGSLVGAALVVAGIGVLVATGGAATPFVLGAVNAGTTAFFYSINHSDTSAGRFWAGFAVNTAVGFALGFVGGAAGGVVSRIELTLAKAAVGSIRQRALAGAAQLMAAPVLGTAYGAAAGSTSQVTYNAADRYIVGRDVGLLDSVGYAALVGAKVGALSAGTVRFSQRGVSAVLRNLDRSGERTPLLSGARPTVLGADHAEWMALHSLFEPTLESAAIMSQAASKQLVAGMPT